MDFSNGSVIGLQSVAVAGSYTFANISDPLAVETNNGPTGTIPSGINDAGQIVGSYQIANGEYEGFLESGGTFTTISDPLATGGTVATAISAAGQIVGYYYTANGIYGFLDSGGTFAQIADPSVRGEMRNVLWGSIMQARSLVITSSGGAYGFLDIGGVFTTISDPLSPNSTTLGGINDAGQIVGGSTRATSRLPSCLAAGSLRTFSQLEMGLSLRGSTMRAKSSVPSLTDPHRIRFPLTSRARSPQ